MWELLPHDKKPARNSAPASKLVQIDVVVLDNKRQSVAGLDPLGLHRRSDNGVQAPIRAFTPVELARPVAAPPVWAGDISPDAVTNQAAREDGQICSSFSSTVRSWRNSQP